MKIADLDKATKSLSKRSVSRKEMHELWKQWLSEGQITQNEYNQYVESCKTPRKVYTIENMPDHVIEAIKNSRMDPKYNYLDKLMEHSDETVNDRIVQKHLDFFGMPVHVEICAGGTKYSKAHDGTPWERHMKCDYGYFDGVTSGDGEYLDCYIGNELDNPKNKVYVIKQMRPDGSEFDESKAMIGFPSEQAAKKMYMTHCHTDKCFGGITEYTIDEFKKTILPND